MEKQPFFTIGVPVYNTEKWLHGTVDSILAQDFDDFELVFCNDGSTDSSLQILKSYAAKHNCIKIINKPNGGVSSARNSIIESAKGKYIYFLDSDDIMCEKALSTAFDMLQRHNFPDVLETSFNIQSGDGTQKSQYVCKYPGDKYFAPHLSKDERAALLWLDTKYSVCVFAKFLKTEFLHKNSILFSACYTMAEDNEFVFKLHRKADTIAFADIYPNIYINPREGSIVSEMSTKSFCSFTAYMAQLFSDYNHFDLSTDFRAENQDKYKDKITEIILYDLNHILKRIHSSASKTEIIEKSAIVDKLFGHHIRNTPFSALGSPVFKLCRIIGTQKTMELLYAYLSCKSIINK